MAVKAANTGMIILGGGLVKHHICNANLMVSMWILLSIASGTYTAHTLHVQSTIMRN
jgi:deoxyhypusine synthase